MNNDSRTEFLVALTVAEEGMRRVHEAACKCSKEELIADLDVGRRYAHFAMEVTKYQRQVSAMLGRYLLDYYTFKTGGVLVPVAEQDIPHSDGAMP